MGEMVVRNRGRRIDLERDWGRHRQSGGGGGRIHTPHSVFGGGVDARSSGCCGGTTMNPPPRTLISRRMIAASGQEPQFAMVASAATHFHPNRRREEARTLQNLRRRVEALRLLQEPHADNANVAASVEANANDGRPLLLQKILTNKPVSMILDMAEMQTAWQDSDFITECLCWHNVYRQRHSSPPLVMSSELCNLAQTWANHLAHTNRFYYRNDKDIGQNLFCRLTNALQTDVTGQEVSAYWYNAFKQYNYGNEPDVLHANVNAGHFTQLVWKSSHCFGVGKARSRSGKVVVVAHYAPPGNVTGAFADNVLPPENEQLATPLPPPSTQRIYLGGESVESESSGTSATSSTR